MEWQLAANRLRQVGAARNVLDVGCFDGRFLASLPEGTDRYGLEIHQGAAERATARGVHIIGNDFSALQGHPGKFDVVTAFDVIEHVRNPAELLGMMISAVRPGGLLMISTGNTQAWSWRLLGSRYWYCKTPEHMSFMCPEWFQSEVPLHSARIAEVVHFSHATSRVRAVRELLANLLYWCLPSLVAMLRWVVGGDGNNGSRGKLDFTPPSWATAKDHMLVVIARDQA